MGDQELLNELRQFVHERDWAQFHTPSTLARSVSIEAAELLELYQWSDEAEPEAIGHELADVLTYCLLLADKLGLDPVKIIREKLEITKVKYPVEKSRGRSDKYDQL